MVVYFTVYFETLRKTQEKDFVLLIDEDKDVLEIHRCFALCICDLNLEVFTRISHCSVSCGSKVSSEPLSRLLYLAMAVKGWLSSEKS